MKTIIKSLKKSEKGQVLVIVALLLTALVAIIGLAVDMGYMYVSYARLRRATDAAALAASGEFKRNYTAAALQGAAEQLLYLNLNGTNTADASVFPLKLTETCDTVAADHGLLPVKNNLPALIAIESAYPVGARVCTDPLRKIVRVVVRQNVQTFFLGVVGIQSFLIEVRSISEAATVDVVLAIDTSDSMTVGWPGAPVTGSFRNPKACNEDDPAGGVDGYPGSCSPFQDVKKAADLFLNNLYFPYDRVSVVTFDKYATMRLKLSDDYATIHGTIINLKVFQGAGGADGVKCPYYASERPGNRWDPGNIALDDDDTPSGPINTCRLHNDPISDGFVFMDCPLFYGPQGDEDASLCGNTNIGDGIALSGAILTGDYSSTPLPVIDWPPKRDEALWVLLLLTDGAANSGHDQNGVEICPDDYNRYPIFWDHPLCRDDNVLVRHCWSASDTDCVNAVGTTNIIDPDHYDPDDYARDMFDIVASNYTLTFTIGMGDAQRADQPRYDVNGTPPGETLLQYGAFGTTPHKTDPNTLKGLYYFGNNQSDLTRIFLEIANNLATRINQ